MEKKTETTPVHTGDGTFDRLVTNGPTGVSVNLPIPCPLRGANYVVIVSDMWDGRFQNVFAAKNIANRVKGRVYVVGESQMIGWDVDIGLPVCSDCGPGWTEGGKANCACGALWMR